MKRENPERRQPRMGVVLLLGGFIRTFDEAFARVAVVALDVGHGKEEHPAVIVRSVTRVQDRWEIEADKRREAPLPGLWFHLRPAT
jgi:hypothetical protein